MSVIPENAATGCPGVESKDAGNASSCNGCPNQTICKSGINSVDPGIALVAEKLKEVNEVILVLSGKGGVGKSTFTTLLARNFSQKFHAQNFGVLDLDICGPSQPRMFGVQDEQVHQSGSGWSPVYIEDNLSLMSIGFLLGGPDEAVIWRGPKKNGLIRQFLSEVDWGNLDILLLDTPPGTSDEHLSSISYLSNAVNNLYAVIVTTPQEVSLLDVRKEISFCKKMKIPIIGVIENMAIYECPKCKNASEIFPKKTGGAIDMCRESGVEFLGSLPLDPVITQRCDSGKSFEDINIRTQGIIDDICEKIYNFKHDK